MPAVTQCIIERHRKVWVKCEQTFRPDAELSAAHNCVWTNLWILSSRHRMPSVRSPRATFRKIAPRKLTHYVFAFPTCSDMFRERGKDSAADDDAPIVNDNAREELYRDTHAPTAVIPIRRGYERVPLFRLRGFVTEWPRPEENAHHVEDSPAHPAYRYYVETVDRFFTGLFLPAIDRRGFLTKLVPNYSCCCCCCCYFSSRKLLCDSI